VRRLVPEKNPKRHKLLQLGSKPVNGDNNGDLDDVMVMGNQQHAERSQALCHPYEATIN
jgi:hypothetical protein